MTPGARYRTGPSDGMNPADIAPGVPYQAAGARGRRNGLVANQDRLIGPEPTTRRRRRKPSEKFFVTPAGRSARRHDPRAGGASRSRTGWFPERHIAPVDAVHARGWMAGPIRTAAFVHGTIWRDGDEGTRGGGKARSRDRSPSLVPDQDRLIGPEPTTRRRRRKPSENFM